MKKNARYNVISVRINDDELESLQHVVRTRRMSVSNIVREAVSQLAVLAQKQRTPTGVPR